MKILHPYLVIIRPGNALMAGTTVALGFWLSGGVSSLLALAQLVIAALCAEGKSTIGNVYQIERGYENLSQRLKDLGAHIERQTSAQNPR